MSLINDALKRAKHAQQQRRPQNDTHPPFQTPDDPYSSKRPSLLGTSLAAAGLATLCILFVWLWLQQSQSEPKTVKARTEPAAVSDAPAVNTETAASPAPANDRPASDNQAKPVQANTVKTPSHGSGASSTQSSAAGSNEPAAASLNPIVPQPEPLRLQAVIYNPRRPSAIINGKTLFIGDRCGDMRVVRITPDSATLVAHGGTTNVLRLP